MAFPAGPLPTATQLIPRDLGYPTKAKLFTHATSDMDLTDPANGMQPCAYELIAQGAGNLVVQMVGDSAPVTYLMAAGAVLHGNFVLIKSTSTCDCIVRQ
jgi:hypothetical protein